MHKLITKLYLKSNGKKNIGSDFCVKARIATDIALSKLNKIGYVPVDYGYGIQLKKSPFSNSCYLQIWEINNHSEKCPIWIIRISNHMCTQLAPNCVLNIFSDNGDFILNSMMIFKMRKNIKELSL
jgi:hypothetical protein